MGREERVGGGKGREGERERGGGGKGERGRESGREEKEGEGGRKGTKGQRYYFSIVSGCGYPGGGARHCSIADHIYHSGVGSCRHKLRPPVVL